MTTPPNPPGFNRKPTPKFKKTIRGRKHPGKKKADISRSQLSPEFIAWYEACRFLMCVATIISPVFFDKPEPSKFTSAE